MQTISVIASVAKQSIQRCNGLPRRAFSRLALIASRSTAHSVALLAMTMLVSACAQPTTATPQISQAELQQELAAQQQAVKLAQGDAAKYEEATYSKAQVAQMQTRLQSVITKLRPEAMKMCHQLTDPQGPCEVKVVLSEEAKGLNAFADGTRVVISPAMMDFTQGETEQLAFILAHEYTHHFMGHVDAAKQNVTIGALAGILGDVLAQSQGISTNGQFSKVGATAGRLSYSPSFEQEADYIGLYILERAKFDTTDAPNFWRRMAAVNPKGIYNRTTHPTTPERFVGMRKTINEINAKKQAGSPLMPNLLAHG
jgi:predicted Zn-dependent protease